MRSCPTCHRSVDDSVATCPDDGTAIPSEPSPLIGQVLGERYKILSQLGEGGMGQVFVAQHVILGKKLAVKVLRPEFNRHADLVARFQQEAVSASQIGQENIVDVADFGRTPDGSFYFVMEYIPGASLANIIDDTGALPTARALPVLLQVTRALDAAHGRGIIHRDLKPDNVIISTRADGSDLAKVLDFGISKVGEGRTGTRLTQVGMVVGTPQYMSPEQATGDPVDARADVYAFGVLAYEVFTGTLPFKADNALGVLLKHQNERPQPPRERRPDLDIDAGVEALILRCLAKRREDRPQAMAEIGSELVRLMGSLGIAGMFTPVPMPAAGGISKPWTDPKLEALPPPVPSGGTSPTVVSATSNPRLSSGNTDFELAGLGKKGPARYVAGGVVAALLFLGTAVIVHGRRPAGDDLQPVVTVPPPKMAVADPPAPPAPAVAPVAAPTPVAPTAAEPKLRKVSVVSEPAGAKVTAARGVLGTTPLTFELPEGSGETLRLRAPGYRTAQREVLASETEVKVTLSKAPPHSADKPGVAGSSTDDDPYGKVDDLKTPY